MPALRQFICYPQNSDLQSVQKWRPWSVRTPHTKMLQCIPCEDLSQRCCCYSIDSSSYLSVSQQVSVVMTHVVYRDLLMSDYYHTLIILFIRTAGSFIIYLTVETLISFTSSCFTNVQIRKLNRKTTDLTFNAAKGKAHQNIWTQCNISDASTPIF